MLISATSALVLNWAHPSLWESEAAAQYFRELDLSEGDQLLNMFKEENQKLHVHIVSGRKFFMKQQADVFLDKHRNGQVIILAAGLAPLSIEIASRHPMAMVFDVDKYLMREKSTLVGNGHDNIRFINCDITETDRLHRALIQHGFDPAIPTLLVLEGIIYYLSTEDLQRILRSFTWAHVKLAGDFCLLPEMLDTRAQEIVQELWSNIMGLVGLSSVALYSEEHLAETLGDSGFGDIRFTNMRDVQKQRTGDFAPFESSDRAWLRPVFAER